MPVIEIITVIKAPVEICFDLSRNIDLHILSTQKTNERAIAGRMTGLVEEGDTVTWQATHLGIRQKLTTRINEVKPYAYFTDQQVSGAFKRFFHEHIFEEKQGNTVMTDRFDYTSPLGFLGKLADFLFLKKYMLGFLLERNALIKDYAENGQWKDLPGMQGQ